MSCFVRFRKATATATRIALRALTLLALTGLASLASAANYIYQIRGDASGATSANIWRVDPALPLESVAVASYPGGNSATLAQCPNGVLYYAINVANGGVYKWNPATPATAPVLLGNLGGSVPSSFRFACSPGGVLYYMPDSGALYTVNTATGAASSTGATITGTGSGGDMAFNAAGTLYVINSSRQLLTAPIGGGAATSLGSITGLGTAASLGLAFGSVGELYVQRQSPASLYRLDLPSLAANFVTNLTGGDIATGDLASTIVAVSPTAAKSFTPTTIVTGGTSTLAIALGNANAFALNAASFIDAYPAGVVNAAAPAVVNTCGGTVTAAAGGTTLTLNLGTIPAAGSCTVSVNVTSAAAGSYTNTLAARAVSTALAYNDSPASATLTVKAPLALAKASSAYSDPFNGTNNPKRIPGAFVDYSVTTTNSASGSIDVNSVVITDPVPANCELFVADLGVAGSGPVAFTNGTPASGLTYTFAGLNSALDDLAFSNNGGTSFVYVPVATANGVDPAVTNIRVNPKGSLVSSGQFQLRFRVRLK